MAAAIALLAAYLFFSFASNIEGLIHVRFGDKPSPHTIVDKLSGETQRIFAEPEFRDRFLAPNMIFSIAGSPEDFTARIRADDAKWGKVIRAANIKAE